MARTDTLGNFLTDVADAIREKKGTSETIQASDFDTEIENLPSGGSSLDWSAIGYSGTPETIQDGYDYAIEIMNNWDTTGGIMSKFYNDYKINFMPMVSIDKTNQKNMSQMFYGACGLMSIPQLDTSNVVNMREMFRDCRALKEIPYLNTTNVTSMYSMFNSCYSLTTIPLLDTSSLNANNSMTSMFTNDRLLTDESLDNILQMCINATSLPANATKTLYDIGMNKSTYPASRIQALPHYQDFIDAGWTIGY